MIIMISEDGSHTVIGLNTEELAHLQTQQPIVTKPFSNNPMILTIFSADTDDHAAALVRTFITDKSDSTSIN